MSSVYTERACMTAGLGFSSRRDTSAGSAVLLQCWRRCPDSVRAVEVEAEALQAEWADVAFPIWHQMERSQGELAPHFEPEMTVHMTRPER